MAASALPAGDMSALLSPATAHRFFSASSNSTWPGLCIFSMLRLRVWNISRTQGTKQALEDARDIRRVQLVNFDLKLAGDVVSKGKEGVQRNDKGYFIKNDSGEIVPIESHSVNLLVERTPTGAIDNMFLACTFYNGEYRDNSGHIVDGATYDLRVPITRDMVHKIEKTPPEKPEFEIDLTGKTGFKVWDEAKQQAVESKLMAYASKNSHANFHAYGQANTRKLYSGNPSTFLAAITPTQIDLGQCWRDRMDVNATLLSSSVENIRHGHPPQEIPPNAKLAALATTLATSVA